MIETNPNNNLEKPTRHPERNQILLIGIGIFGGISILSYAFLFEIIVKDICFNISIRPNYTVIITELVSFTTFIIGITVLVNIIKSSKISELNIFISSILLLLLAQTLQFFEPIVVTKFKTEPYLDNSIQYYEFLTENIYYFSIPIISLIILPIIAGMIIYLKRK